MAAEQNREMRWRQKRKILHTLCAENEKTAPYGWRREGKNRKAADVRVYARASAAGCEGAWGGVPPTKKNKRSFDRKRGTAGEKARGVFGCWAEGSGTVFDEAEFTGVSSLSVFPS